MKEMKEMKEMEAMKNLANTTFDYKDTAGYRLMQHEEFLKKMINKKRRVTSNESTNNRTSDKTRISEHKN